jgi:hypothetical protein
MARYPWHPTWTGPPTETGATAVATGVTMRPHLPDGIHVPDAPIAIRPLLVEAGEAAGHRLLLLSLEDWGAWADLRFARIATAGAPPLARRIPLASDWHVEIDGVSVEVLGVAGRGDRAFSNGEVRLRPSPLPGSTLRVQATLAPGASVDVELIVTA